ncbi:DNA polymerase III subunit delta' [Campylobacter sputorum subsp. bubulus]|uniref:DNA polymerase III subunit delta n=1 Tax=Campylobacter sputorum subsp. sputorum TaxID=32024 RepID=A0A381DLC7_9BACT|nr:DNA polymerase III subunit delta' [Campylobacter sputorum]ASM34690.1 DNA polymerase III, delta prime subunit [Campylobacter sputorum aubsp. sputorum RM3237]KAB0581748.1 DNA polymerase III subunit delta' [Campylobacter sputorum subsp. sputorum]QEL04881.1 DNA polymerase III, delta prime subunit [Campylobacter sputorum subsp. sputorum]SUX09926.1 DNA polymerase III subunit delta' [Campylobacter sputorum subsp. bubulus]SUX11367.1 DNA polymerase III subunit delta' [Campylobacter sputorum subsp. s
MQSEIIISNDFESIKNEILANYDINDIRFFEVDEFLVEDARDIIKESYIAEVSEKLIVIMAKSYRIEAQNALLKILEEPPKNIFFCIVTTSKSLLLPTIKSRLVIKNRLKKIQRSEIGLNLKKLELKEIVEFIDEKSALQRSDKLDKNELLKLFDDILYAAFIQGINFSANELEYFYKLSTLITLNAKPHTILTPLLLMIYKK